MNESVLEIKFSPEIVIQNLIQKLQSEVRWDVVGFTFQFF
jgi:hypothetical protein